MEDMVWVGWRLEKEKFLGKVMEVVVVVVMVVREVMVVGIGRK